MLGESNLKYNLVDEYTIVTDNFEVMTVQETENLFCAMYHPPGVNIYVLYRFLGCLIDIVVTNKLKQYLNGDMNIDRNADYVEIREFTAILEANGLCNAVGTPTRICCEPSTLLDLFIANDIVEDVTVAKIVSDISVHCPIFSIISNKQPSQSVLNAPKHVQLLSPR